VGLGSAMMNGNGPLVHLPVLNGKNYDAWCIQMKVIFGMQDVLDIIMAGLQELEKDAGEAQKRMFRESKKLDYKAIFLIHQCMDPQKFAKIVSATSAKQAWDILAKVYVGSERLKRVKMQTLKRQFELLQMKEKEGVAEYLNQVQGLSNKMMACGANLKDQDLVEKVLRTLSSRFDYVVAAIEESKDFTKIKLDELQCSLEAHEQRIKERETDRPFEQALFTQSGRKYKPGPDSGKVKIKQKSHKSKRARDDSTDDSSADEANRDDGGSQSRQTGLPHNGKNGNTKRKQVQYCREWGHFATQCKARKQLKGRDDQAQLAQESESEEDLILLMVTNDSDKATNSEWYLDTGCSNYMTGRKDWLVDLDESVKKNVRFANNSTVKAEGLGRVLIHRKDGKRFVISEVLYVPNMHNNLLSLE